ncbi:MAG: MipA/OmpV family protein [Burkholderiales bacterium]|nr:MipA/OmpV family protein [Burkholderiales bacterium]
MTAFRRSATATCSFIAVSLSSALHAQESSKEEPPLRQDVTSIPVSRSFNLIGVGVGLIPEFSGSESYRVLVLPLARASYKDTLYINGIQGGAWLYNSDDKSVRIGLQLGPRFGWKGKGGTPVAGMEERDFSFEGGPNIQWRTPIGVFNAELSWDLGGASNGTTAQLQYIRALVASPTFRLNGTIGVQWFDGKMNNYYFGVRPGEVTPTRPGYTARSSSNFQIGVNGSYQVSQRGSVMFGVSTSYLGDGAGESPIVETRVQNVIYVGYGITF